MAELMSDYRNNVCLARKHMNALIVQQVFFTVGDQAPVLHGCELRS